MQQPGRLRLRLWLERQIESGKYPGVSWLDKSAKIFQIPWKHAARHGWSIDRDATLFRSWAMHTGRYHPGKDKPDPKTWKANFRCALNSLPDIFELQEHSKKRGSNAYRVYRMLPIAQAHRRKRGMKQLGQTTDKRAALGVCAAADACAMSSWEPTTTTTTTMTTLTPTPLSDTPLKEEAHAEDGVLSAQTHRMWEADAEEQEQSEAVFKLTDHLSNADLWNQTGVQRGWRTHTLWDHCHCPGDDLYSLHTDNYNEFFGPNYIKEVSDWSAYQQTLMP